MDCEVIQAEGDADVEIAKAAIAHTRVQSTTLIGEDADLLILLYYVDINNRGLFFRSDKSDASAKVYNISNLKASIGADLIPYLMFLNAMTACDTTSRNRKEVCPQQTY